MLAELFEGLFKFIFRCIFELIFESFFNLFVVLDTQEKKRNQRGKKALLAQERQVGNIVGACYTLFYLSLIARLIWAGCTQASLLPYWGEACIALCIFSLLSELGLRALPHALNCQNNTLNIITLCTGLRPAGLYLLRAIPLINLISYGIYYILKL